MALRAINHVAYIVDGNGRWGQQQGMTRSYGHIKGASKTVEIVKQTFALNVSVVTLYLFSTENWHRPKEEVECIMNLLSTYLKEFDSYLRDNNVAIRVIGQVGRLPESVIATLESVGHQQSSGSKFTNDESSNRILCLAISYGGRDDIVNACKSLVRTVQNGLIDVEDINEDTFASATSTGLLGIPDPDVVIRTSGEFRLSNFLLWQCAYAEFVSVGKFCE